MTNPQGTVWESQIRDDVKKSLGLTTDRYPKRGQKGEPDLWIRHKSSVGLKVIPMVAWKRLVGKKRDGRRKPDGVRAVVVFDYNDFLDMLPYLPYHFEVQAKWTSALNVTRTLGELQTWLKENR